MKQPKYKVGETLNYLDYSINPITLKESKIIDILVRIGIEGKFPLKEVDQSVIDKHTYFYYVLEDNLPCPEGDHCSNNIVEMQKKLIEENSRYCEKVGYEKNRL